VATPLFIFLTKINIYIFYSPCRNSGCDKSE